MTITDSQADYAEKLLARLKEKKIRATVDSGSDKIGAKIRKAELAKIPYTLVIGDREVENNQIALRRRLKGDLGSVAVDDFIGKAAAEINNRILPENAEW